MIVFIALLLSVPPPTPSRVETVRYESAALARRDHYQVYLPPGYEATRAYPIVVLLHGLGGTGSDWFDPAQGDLRTIADGLITRGTIRPFIAIAPEGHDGYWTDHVSRARGSAYGAAVIEVLDDAKGRYAMADAASIVGVSAGGHGAMSVGLVHRERFAAIVSMSGALFDVPPTHRPIYLKVWGDPPDAAWFERTAPMPILRALPASTPIPAMWLHVGKLETDRFVPWNAAADALLTARKIPHTFIISEGGHGWSTWRGVMADWLVWLDAAPRRN